MTQNPQSQREFVDVEPDNNNIQKFIYGQTPENEQTWIYPQVIIQPLSSRSVKLDTTTTQLRGLQALITRVGRYKVGDNFLLTFFDQGYQLGRTEPLQRYRLIDVTPPANQSAYFTVWINITEEAHAEIINEESDHLADYEYAFQLICQRVADEINKLAGGSYKNEQEVIQLLVQALGNDAPQLIPPDPTNLDSWEDHLKVVAQQLTTQSAKRDKAEAGGDHLPKGYTALFDNDQVYMTPQSKQLHRHPSEIIKLEEVPIVFDPATLGKASPQVVAPKMRSATQPAQLVPGYEAKLKQKLTVFIYLTDAGARQKATLRHEGAATNMDIAANTIVTIVDTNVTDPNAQTIQALVSFDKQAGSGIDPDFFSLYDTQTFFFWVNATELLST